MKDTLSRKALLAIISIALLLPARSLIAEEYLWPIHGYQTLTGTFGEFRSNHFHAGVDISTQGSIGIPLKAVDDGYVSRIRTSPFGYGKAVYLTLRDGNVAVYGHLSRFNQPIATWVRERQLASGEFSVDAYPKPALFTVNKGDLIGYSGDSGNVAAHLHFELRNRENQPFNPLNHLGSLPTGLVPPRIVALAIDPIGIDSTVDATWETKTYKARWDTKAQAYTIPEDIFVWGRCGIGIVAHDSSRGYQMGVRKVQLYANDRLVSTVEHNSFSFQEYRHNYRMVDRELFLHGKGKFRRLYQTGKQHLSFYEIADGGDGTLSTVNTSSLAALKRGANRMKITVEGNGGQKRSLLFCLIGRPSLFHEEAPVLANETGHSLAPLDGLKAQCSIRFLEDFVLIEMTTDQAPPSLPRCFIHQGDEQGEKIAFFPRSPTSYIGRYRLNPHVDGMSHARVLFTSPSGEQKETFHSFMVQTVSPEKGGTVVSDDTVVRVTFRPEDVDTCMFPQIEKAPVNPQPTSLEPLSLSYAIKPLSVMFTSPGEITFRNSKSTARPHQCAVFYRDKGKYWRCLSTRYDPKKETLTARIPSFATFALMRDGLAPVITHVFPQSGRAVRWDNTRFSARISDKGTGINYRKTYMRIDGSKVPAEYIPKKGILLFTAPEPLGAGPHSLEVGTSDLVGNISETAIAFVVGTK